MVESTDFEVGAFGFQSQLHKLAPPGASDSTCLSSFLGCTTGRLRPE